MIVDFYDYVELLSKAVYEISSSRPRFALLWLSKQTHFYGQQMSGRKVALVYLLVEFYEINSILCLLDSHGK